MNGEEFIFIGGVPRSGTSLVQKILDLNDSIYGGPEFANLPAISKLYTRMLNDVNNGRHLVYYDEEKLNNHFRSFISKIFHDKLEESGSLIFSEKTPNNIRCFDFLKALFPKSKFVFVVRDPRACLNSFIKVGQRAKKFGDIVPIGVNVFSDLSIIQNDISIGNDFYLNNKDSCYLIYYEDLLNDAEFEIKNLCSFLKVEYSENMLKTESSNDNSTLMGGENTRSWYSKDMFDRKIDVNAAESWKEELNPKYNKLANYYFSKAKIECLNNKYSFGAVKKSSLLQLTPLYIRHLGFRSLLQSLRKTLF